MEDVLDLYEEESDPTRPRVCFDEQPYQMISELREPLPPKPGKPERYDYEYGREGTCNIFMFFCLLVMAAIFFALTIVRMGGGNMTGKL